MASTPGNCGQGALALFAGTVSSFRGRRQLVHPEYELLPETVADERLTNEIAVEFANELIPYVTPASAKLTSWTISKHVGAVLDSLGPSEDPLPEEVRQRYHLWPSELAIRAIHRPQDREDLRHARRRLKWDEAFTMQVALAQRRHAAAAMPAGAEAADDGIAAAFDRRLPFILTEGQQEVGEEVVNRARPRQRPPHAPPAAGRRRERQDGRRPACHAPRRRRRGPGRVARTNRGARGAAPPIGHGADGAVGRRRPLGSAEVATRVALVTGSQRTARRRQELLDVVSGTAGIVIGTHALIEDAVEFRDLALVVVDEQHRFGVEQRAALTAKAKDGSRPHVLVMTATPIPRTIAMTVFGDIDVSTLSELPAGRAPISTHVVAAREQPRHMARVWQRVREEVAAGRRLRGVPAHRRLPIG